MTDGQLAALISALVGVATTVGAAIRWAVLRMVKAQDAATDAMIQHAGTMADSSAANRELVSEVKSAIRRIDTIADFIEEETSGVHDVSDLRKKMQRAARETRDKPRMKTNPGVPIAGGYYGPRRPPRQDDE